MKLQRAAAVPGKVGKIGAGDPRIEGPPKRRELEPRDRGIVHQIGLAEIFDASGGLHPVKPIRRDIERIEETPAGGREGAPAVRLGQEERVQRIDAKEIGTRAPAGLGEFAEIGKIADPPVSRGPQFVKLTEDAPAGRLVQGWRQPASCACGNFHPLGRHRPRGRCLGVDAKPLKDEAYRFLWNDTRLGPPERIRIGERHAVMLGKLA